MPDVAHNLATLFDAADSVEYSGGVRFAATHFIAENSAFQKTIWAAKSLSNFALKATSRLGTHFF